MKAINGYNAAKESTGDFEKLPAGGYVCKITKVEDVENKEYLKITFDIYEGEYRGWYREQRERLAENGFDSSYVGTTLRSYKQSALGFFKAFISAVDASNGTKFGPYVEQGLDEQKLVGALVGFVIGYEEYERTKGKKAGSIGQREKVFYVKPVDKIRFGDFKVPELKKLEGGSQAVSNADASSDPFAALDDVDESGLPF